MYQICKIIFLFLRHTLKDLVVTEHVYNLHIQTHTNIHNLFLSPWSARPMTKGIWRRSKNMIYPFIPFFLCNWQIMVRRGKEGCLINCWVWQDSLYSYSLLTNPEKHLCLQMSVALFRMPLFSPGFYSSINKEQKISYSSFCDISLHV